MPSLSVVIPCRDDSGPLERCLQALARQSLLPTEVIVVDNACSDNSAGIAELYGAAVIVEATTSIAAAAAAGYDSARGEIIVRCDADSEPPPDWLKRIAERFASDQTLAGLTGPGVFYGISPTRAAVAHAVYMMPYFLLMGSAMAHWPLFGSNMALRRSVWCEVRDQVHRADPNVHDDVDLSFVLGPRRVHYDRHLRVGISSRALRGTGNARHRLRRAFHTLQVHWQQQSPGRRWQQRWMTH